MKLLMWALRLVEVAVLQAAIVGVVGLSIMEFQPLPGPFCGDVIMKQLTSSKPIHGSFDCTSGRLQVRAIKYGIFDDQTFADQLGMNGQWKYLGRATDGGYLYEAIIAQASYTYILYPDQNGRIGELQ